jgi:membrane protein
LVCAITVLIVGPKVGVWIARKMALAAIFASIWPLVHGTIAVGFAVLAVQMIYFLAPNVKQRFRATLPGAALAVAGCTGLSYLLAIYFRYFQNYDRIYGTLGGLMALMTWLYWAYYIVLVGGELNAQLHKEGEISPLAGMASTTRSFGGVAKREVT